MPRGSYWKRLAVFSDEVNQEHAPDVARVLRAERIEMEWWHRSVPTGQGKGRALCVVDNLGREGHPLSEEWLMVRRGDWPMAFVIAKHFGVSL
jgi:hypothetical protein